MMAVLLCDQPRSTFNIPLRYWKGLLSAGTASTALGEAFCYPHENSLPHLSSRSETGGTRRHDL